MSLTSDQEAPYFTNCPTINIIKATANNRDFRRVSWSAPQVQDNVDAPNELTGISQSHAPGSAFPVGDTEIVYMASDTSGNTGNCTFFISVYGKPCYALLLLSLLAISYTGV